MNSSQREFVFLLYLYHFEEEVSYCNLQEIASNQVVLQNRSLSFFKTRRECEGLFTNDVVHHFSDQENIHLFY